MEMSEKEILKSYNDAASKSKQIKILADLNACGTQQIKDVLSRNGIKLRGIKTEPEKIDTHSIDDAIEQKQADDLNEAIRVAMDAIREEIIRMNEKLMELGTKERALLDDIQKLRKSLKTLEEKYE